MPASSRAGGKPGRRITASRAATYGPESASREFGQRRELWDSSAIVQAVMRALETPWFDDSVVTEPSRRDMGVSHGTSAAQSLLTFRRLSPAFAVFAIALAVFSSSVAIVLTGSGGAFPWLMVAALAGAPILLGLVSALLTMWRTEDREPYYLR